VAVTRLDELRARLRWRWHLDHPELSDLLGTD
jgi:hypothetical protein